LTPALGHGYKKINLPALFPGLRIRSSVKGSELIAINQLLP
jgi:hypothetical protein